MPRQHKKTTSRKPFGKKLPGQKRGPTSRRPTKGRRAQARVNFDQEGERLQKVLAAAGVASRREAEQLILEGRVEVDGQTVTELGTRVDRQRQHIQVDGEPLAKPKLAYFAVNKPEGVVCTANDPAGRTLVTDLLPPEVGRVFNVGRLDIASEGLILVTNDGALANQLTHPRHGVEKTYEVQVAGHLDAEVLAQLRKGVHLAEGFVRVVHVRVKSRRKNGTILEMVLDEGRNREIRRLLAKVGHRVQRLTRIAVGPIRLGEMPKGASRRLTPEEVRKLQAYVREAEKKPRREEGQPQQPATRQGSLDWRQRKRQAAAGKAASSKAASSKPARGKKTKRGRR
ncbi:MAG: rRNA pseudouridine synthase [Planctomycetes bacterium]|nr:rRNA pseudouridine synthase [Planctomycetota bacterium]